MVLALEKDRTKYIKSFISPINNELKNINVNADVFGRAKHIYSINNKMKLKNISFSEIFDQFAIRIIANKSVRKPGVIKNIPETKMKRLSDKFSKFNCNELREFTLYFCKAFFQCALTKESPRKAVKTVKNKTYKKPI